MRKAPVEKVKEFRLKFRPEIQAAIDARPLVRRLTETERKVREFERTKDYRKCVCCQFMQPPHLFNHPTVPVCHQCAWRAAVYGRRTTHQRIDGTAAAMAVIRALERTACQMR